MGKIKTRKTVKNVKVIDKAAVAGERMKNAFIRSKDGTENLMDDRQVTPSEYAEDKVLYAAEDISHGAVYLAGSGIKTATNKGKEAFQRQRTEKAAEKLQARSPTSEPPASEQPSPAEHWQTPSSTQTNAPNVTLAEQSKVPVTERPLTPQARPVRQGYQPVSTGDSGTTLYSDADRMVDEGRELTKKKAKQKTEVGKQIKQQTDKIAHQPVRTAKPTDAFSGLRHTDETIQAAERPAQFIGKSVHGAKAPVRSMEQSARTAKQTTQAAKQSVRTMEQSVHTIKQTAKSTGKATAKTTKGTIKTSQWAVKTAQQTSKAAIKTTQATAKAAQKTAQATAKAARAASAAAKAMAKAAAVAAKTVAKAVAAAGKAIIAGSKALIAAIAAGGWVAVLVIVIICLIALIVGSCFGIFFSSEDTGSDQTMHEVIREISTDYDNQLENIKQSYVYDGLEMYGSRAGWKEVLAVYAVKTTTDPNSPQEVASMDDGKKALLKEIFWAMNVISARTETFQTTEDTDTVDDNGNTVQEQTTVTKTVLYITVSHKTAEEMAEEYGFTEDQQEQLAALLAEENDSLWSASFSV